MTKRNEGFQTVEIARKDKPDARFAGRLLGSVDSNTLKSREKAPGRWTRLELWELESGNWVAAAIGCSDRPGEFDLGDVEVIRTHAVEGEAGEGERAELSPADRRVAVMRFFGWTWLAKALAEQLGWDVQEVIQ